MTPEEHVRALIEDRKREIRRRHRRHRHADRHYGLQARRTAKLTRQYPTQQ